MWLIKINSGWELKKKIKNKWITTQDRKGSFDDEMNTPTGLLGGWGKIKQRHGQSEEQTLQHAENNGPMDIDETRCITLGSQMGEQSRLYTV